MYAIRSYYDLSRFNPVAASGIALDKQNGHLQECAVVSMAAGPSTGCGVITSYSIHYTKLYDMVVVTHEMSFAREAASRVVFLDGGIVLEEGPPEESYNFV